MNHITKLVLEDVEQKLGQLNPQNKPAKIEGIFTSAIQTKTDTQEPNNPWTTYYLDFFALEGISNRGLPVIFRLKDNIKPNIPPRAKVLLTGQWADRTISPRPSFTCTEYQILTPPSPPTIKSLREQISSLLTTSLEKQSEWKQRTDYLFKKQKDLSELDKLTKLGDQYLSAYLLLRRVYYANYQDNLLQHTADLDNAEAYLTKLAGEIEEIAQHVRAYQSKEI